MANTLGLSMVVEADTRGLEDGVKRARSAIQDLQQEVQAAVTAQTAAMRTIASIGERGLGELSRFVGNMASGIAGAGETVDVLKARFQALTGNVGEAASSMNEVFRIAGTREMADFSARLARGLTSVRLQGDELRRVLERIPQAIAGEAGIEQIRELATRGRIAGDVIFNAIRDAAQEASKTFEELPATVSRLFAAAENEFTGLLSTVDEKLQISRFFQSITDTVHSGVRELADLIGGINLPDVRGWMEKNIPKLDEISLPDIRGWLAGTFQRLAGIGLPDVRGWLAETLHPGLAPGPDPESTLKKGARYRSWLSAHTPTKTGDADSRREQETQDGIRLLQETEMAANSVFQGMENGLNHFVATGKIRFSEFANSVIADLARIAVRQAILAPLSSLLGGLFAGGSTPPGMIPAAGGGFRPTSHTGGIVGRGPAANRWVPDALFAGADRFHGGGIVAPGEVPAILRRGEGVFTPEQMRALGSGSKVTVNVHEAPGTRSTIRQRQDDNGGLSLDVIVEQIESAIGERISRGTGLDPLLQGRFGLAPRGA